MTGLARRGTRPIAPPAWRASAARPSGGGSSCSRPRRSRSRSCSPPGSRSSWSATSCATRSTTPPQPGRADSIPHELAAAGSGPPGDDVLVLPPARSEQRRIRPGRAAQRHGDPAPGTRSSCRSTSGRSRWRSASAGPSSATRRQRRPRRATRPAPPGDAVQAVRPLEQVDRTLRTSRSRSCWSASAASRSRCGSAGSSRAPRWRRWAADQRPSRSPRTRDLSRRIGPTAPTS